MTAPGARSIVPPTDVTSPSTTALGPSRTEPPDRDDVAIDVAINTHRATDRHHVAVDVFAGWNVDASADPDLVAFLAHERGALTIVVIQRLIFIAWFCCGVIRGCPHRRPYQPPRIGSWWRPDPEQDTTCGRVR